MGWCVVFSLELKMCFFIIKQAFISILGKKQLLACKKGCKFLVSSICIQSNCFKERLPIVSISWASLDPWYVYLCSLSHRSHFFKMFFKKDMTLKKRHFEERYLSRNNLSCCSKKQPHSSIYHHLAHNVQGAIEIQGPWSYPCNIWPKVKWIDWVTVDIYGPCFITFKRP